MSTANNQITKKAPSANNPTTKKAPLIVKDSEKAQVLTKYRDYYRYLHGKYEGKYNETNRNIKWQKLLEYSQTLDGFKDKLSTPEELKEKIDNWKKAMNKKEKKNSRRVLHLLRVGLRVRRFFGTLSINTILISTKLRYTSLFFLPNQLLFHLSLAAILDLSSVVFTIFFLLFCF